MLYDVRMQRYTLAFMCPSVNMGKEGAGETGAHKVKNCGVPQSINRSCFGSQAGAFECVVVALKGVQIWN